MFYITSKLLGFLCKPIIWILFLLLYSLIYSKKSKIITIITISLFYIFTNRFIADEAARLWQPESKKITDLAEKYNYGIVLGGYSSYNHSNKQIDLNENGDRIITAIQLYKLKKIQKIIISGGNGEIIHNNLKEAKWSKKLLINMGIKKEDIILETNSRNTLENARFSSKLVKLNKKVLIITSANHIKRASFCFNKENIEHDIFPTDCVKKRKKNISYLLTPDIKALYQWESLIHEWIGYFVYKIIV